MFKIENYLSKLGSNTFAIFLFHGVTKNSCNGVRNYTKKHILSNDFGQIPENETLSIEFNVTTENLENNSYQSFIFINSNANVESSIIPVMLTVSENGLLLGDLNQDEIIDILDVVRLVSIVLGQYTPTSFESLLADLNQDDIINVQDILLMINIILSE